MVVIVGRLICRSLNPGHCCALSKMFGPFSKRWSLRPGYSKTLRDARERWQPWLVLPYAFWKWDS